MATDNYQAEAVIGGILAVDPQLKLMALSGTPVVGEARAAGLEVIEETFADRTYTDEGRLVPRKQPGAVHDDVDTVVKQALAIATGQPFASVNGTPVEVSGQSICVHGDSHKALEMVQAIITALKQEGIAIC